MTCILQGLPYRMSKPINKQTKSKADMKAKPLKKSGEYLKKYEYVEDNTTIVKSVPTQSKVRKTNKTFFKL